MGADTAAAQIIAAPPLSPLPMKSRLAPTPAHPPRFLLGREMVPEDGQKRLFLGGRSFLPVGDDSSLEIKLVDSEKDIGQTAGLIEWSDFPFVRLALANGLLKISQEDLLGPVLVIKNELARPFGVALPQSFIQPGRKRGGIGLSGIKARKVGPQQKTEKGYYDAEKEAAASPHDTVLGPTARRRNIQLNNKILSNSPWASVRYLEF